MIMKWKVAKSVGPLILEAYRKDKFSAVLDQKVNGQIGSDPVSFEEFYSVLTRRFPKYQIILTD